MSFSTRSISRSPSSSPSKTHSFGGSSRSSFGQSQTSTSPSRTSAVGYSSQSSFGPSQTPTASRTSAVGYSDQSSFQASARGAPAGVVREPGPREFFSRLFGGGRNAVPSETRNSSVPADDAQRTPQFARAQEQAVLGSGGRPVQFTNSNGQTEALQFSRGADGWRVSDTHNNSILVRGQGLTEDQFTQGTAEIADYWTQQPTHLRNAASTFDLVRGNRSADFQNVNGGLITMSLRYLDEKGFDHEFGHAIGHAQRPYTQVGQTDFGRPAGWDAAMRADGSSPSQYANNNEREDFAESWLAYTEAREASPERLAALQQAYPNRFALIEQLYNGAERS